MPNGVQNGNGEVVVKVNTTYLRLFQTIAGGVIALVLTVGAFIVRVEVNAATMHADVTSILEKIAVSQEAIKEGQSDIKTLTKDLAELRVQVATGQAVAEAQRKQMNRGLTEIKGAVEEKIPEPKHK